MTPKTPKPASSKSANHLFSAVALLSLGLVALSLTLALSVSSMSSSEKSSQSYNNLFSRAALAGKRSRNLTIQAASISLSLPHRELAVWQTAVPSNYKPRPESSLLQYFYAQLGVAHPWASYQPSSRITGYAFNEDRLGSWILENATRLNREPRNAVLTIENGRAVQFQEHLSGYTLSAHSAAHALKTAILAGNTELEISLDLRSPEIRLSNLNNLGIRERVATGQSDFTGSSAARINNIRVGAAQYNGVILAPGEEFSFNKYLGPVDAEHGFRPELVIKPEGATPEFGGGLCQVSTTAFRAAFFGGLPITQRRNHSYAVHYYEWIADDRPRAVGLDATIYAPYQDMKFVNNTPGSLLISTRLEGKRLYFDFYGTPDDRRVLVDGPHPFDKKASGAVKSTVRRTVIKDGQSQEVTFNSVYIPAKTAKQTLELPAAPPPFAPTTPPPGVPAPSPTTN